MLKSKRVLVCLLAAFLVGATSIVALRYFMVSNKVTHYHADFGLFINGTRDEFKNFNFYEEVQACSQDNSMNPRARVHLHNQENSIIHVHDNAVTWSAFFANLGYGLTDKTIVTSDGTFLDGQDGKKLTFYLNGKKVETITNRVIEDKDDLLVSYGTEDEAAIKAQYAQIPVNAAKEDAEKDPASCGGSAGLTPSVRLKRAFNFSN